MSSLRISHYVARTSCEGPGERAALWVSGCSLQCPGCCNPELFDPRAGESIEISALVETLAAEKAGATREGLSVLGGEPLDQGEALADFLTALRARRPKWGIIVFTGYRARELILRPGWERLRRLVDTFVAGPFEAKELEPVHGGRRFIGSLNQSLEHMSPRYREDALWRGPRRAELHIDARGGVSVHGDPELTRRVRRRLRLVSSTAAGVQPRLGLPLETGLGSQAKVDVAGESDMTPAIDPPSVDAISSGVEKHPTAR